MTLPKKKAIYTVITGNYDLLFPPVVNQPGWDMLCFTDSSEVVSNFWQVRPMPELSEMEGLDAVTRARLVKILPHRFLQEYEYSVYIDANRILSGSITEYVREHGAPRLLCFGSWFKDAYNAAKDMLCAGADKNPFALTAHRALSKPEAKYLKEEMKR